MAAPHIPDRVIQKMKDLNIAEWEVLDVFNSGEYKTLESGMKVAIKKYKGYEIGLGYDQGKRRGEYIILTVWKRERR